MRRVAIALQCVAFVLISFAISGVAQDRAATPGAADPRVGLKPGFRDAGVAARNMELVATMPKPEGFFNPKAPSGVAVPPEAPASSNTPPEGSTPPAAPGNASPAAPPAGLASAL